MALEQRVKAYFKKCKEDFYQSPGDFGEWGGVAANGGRTPFHEVYERVAKQFNITPEEVFKIVKGKDGQSN